MARVLHDTNLVDRIGGAYRKDGSFLSWFELCPAEFEGEIFRDR